MASLKEVKNRLNSVNSTRKITSAMKMVASSKLHHAQRMIENMLPYGNMLEGMLKSFLSAEVDAQSEFTAERPVKRIALVVFTSNSSMCGGFNNNTIKLMQQVIDQYSQLGKDNILIYPIGRKVAEKVAKLGYKSAGSFTALADKPNPQGCAEIAQQLAQMYRQGEVDRVELIYHHFKSAGSQVLTRKTFLPIDIHAELDRDHYRDLTSNVTSKESQEYLKAKEDNHEKVGVKATVQLNDNYIIEPDMETILSELIPKMLNLMIYVALLDSNASEHAARMVAMQTATDNADELLEQLTLQYNKTRQAAITAELLDIVGASFQ